MIERAYGKINLSLDVIGKREDGYHNLKSIMLPVDIYDEVSIELAKEDSYFCNIDLPYDKNNIVYRCVEMMKKQANSKQCFKIEIHKNIPMQAGLAGGSSNGAAAVRILNKLLNLNYSLEELAKLTSQIGADIPYCLYSKPAVVQGIGEKVSPFLYDKPLELLLIKPNQGIETAKSFKMLDLEKCAHPNIDKLQYALVNGLKISDLLGNSLMYSSSFLCEEVGKIIEQSKKMGYPNTLMTGSGSTVFVLAYENENLDRLYDYMSQKYDFVYKTNLLVM